MDNYEISRQIGKGKYAIVFEAADPRRRRTVALKVFKPERTRDRIEREVQILRHVAGGVNVVELLDVVSDDEGFTRALALELVEHEDFRSLFPRFGDADVRFYVRAVLEALRFCHARGVMHRDVRPHNVLRLVGWGSATFYHPGETYTSRVSLWQAPELLLDVGRYDPRVDVWALGAMAAGMVFRREPFFHGVSRADQMRRIAGVLGGRAFVEYADRLGLEEADLGMEGVGEIEGRGLRAFVNGGNEGTAGEEALAFLEGVLRVDHEQRWTAEQALSHAYLSKE